MKFALVERIDAARGVNKDQMGGYGIEITVGKSLGARFIERQARRNVPILTLGYVAALLSRQGHVVEVIADGRLPRDADVTIIYSSIVESSAEVAYARRLKQSSATVVGFVGPFAAHQPDVYDDVADFIVIGEPEAVIERLAHGEIPKGRVQSTAPSDLDALPYPDWDPFALATYSYYPIIEARPFVTMQASRGCDFTCSYCPYLAYYGNVRKRSLPNVLGEIEHLVRRHGIRGVYFRDPLFTVDQSWALEFSRELLASGLRIEWGCETRMEMLSEDLIDAMYRAGLRGINCGIESADNTVLKSAARHNAFGKVERMITACERRGVRVTAFYVFGLLADTRESIKATIAYAKRLNTFGAKFHLNTPFPGTPFHREVRHLIFEKDWERFNACTPVFHHPNLAPEDLLRLKEQAYVSYYLRPSYLAKHWRHVARAALA